MESSEQPIELPRSGPLVVLGSVWSEQGCRVRLRQPGQPSFLAPAVGLELRYRLVADGPRHCIGHHSPRRNEGNYLDCDNRPRDGEKTCVRCAVADAEFAADLHHAHTRDRTEIHRSVLDHLDQANVLYLAAFRDGSIKVGTSTGTRRKTRLIEQGAWLAVEAAEVADGFAVRRLEDLVTDIVGLPQAVNISRKLKGMTSPRAEADLKAQLVNRLGDVHGLVADGAETLGRATPTEDWWRFPGADAPCWQRPLRYPNPIDAGAHHLVIVDMCGRVAAISRPGGRDHFIDDLGRLFGRELEIGDFELDELMVQDSLF